MTPYYADDLVTVHHGDCLDVLRELPDASVDAVVTDPPYGLGFMGREWDDLPPGLPFAAECLRVLKPGGHLLAFGGSRTWHRLAVAIEDAGFEVRDSIAWLYGSGFPKSLDVSKAIDKAAGHVGVVVGTEVVDIGMQGGKMHTGRPRALAEREVRAPSDVAADWQGWGTALKPAFEPIVVGRKPLVGTVAANVLAHGTGALNIDGCRVDGAFESGWSKSGSKAGPNTSMSGPNYERDPKPDNPAGRWPANVLLGHAPACVQVGTRTETVGGGEKASGGFVEGYEPGDGFVGRAVESPVYRCAPGCQVAELDRQSGASVSRVGTPRGAASGDGWGMTATGSEYDDQGGASRFFPTFRYEAKAPTTERPRIGGGGGAIAANVCALCGRQDLSGRRCECPEPQWIPRGGGEVVAHPTVKPLDLMRWLVRLVTPPGGTVLEPFAGSGTTAEACVIEGFRCIAVEREAAYLPLIVARLSKPIQPDLFGGAA